MIIVYQIYNYDGDKIFDAFYSRHSAQYMIDNYLDCKHFIVEIER